MKVRKLSAIFLTFVMAVSFMTGCASSNGNQSSQNSENKTTNENKTTGENKTIEVGEVENQQSEADSENMTEGQAEDTSAPAETGKTLVVYYSASGNTKGVAETIAEITDADLFEIEPEDSYTSADLDWTKKDSRVSKEHDDESLRDVKLVSTTVDNWDSYDVVYIGYPIWWGIAAWPVDGFVKANDFTGKTVIPFCTAASSGIGNSGKLLEDMAGTGNWKDGERFRGGASKSDISKWIDGLD